MNLDTLLTCAPSLATQHAAIGVGGHTSLARMISFAKLTPTKWEGNVIALSHVFFVNKQVIRAGTANAPRGEPSPCHPLLQPNGPPLLLQNKLHHPTPPPPQDTPDDEDSPPPPPPKNKGKGKAVAESLVSTQREAPTLDTVPIRVKPSRAQLNREWAKKWATYQKGRASGLVDPAPMMTTAPPLPSNRFELLPDDADDVEALVPVPLEIGEPDLPPLAQPRSIALMQQDFQIRERAMFVDIASLPSEAMIQLAITRKYTDHNVAANAMRAADKAWGGNGDLERILGYQARYAHVHQWPLTADDTLAAITSEANEGFHTMDEVAAMYQRTTAASVTPLDFFFARTE
jgi:hypothetical protein